MKTIEEAAEESFKKQCEPETSSCECFFHYTDKKLYSTGFSDGVEFAQRWIDPKEELPEVGVLVQIKLTEFIRNSIYYDHDRVIDNNGFKMFECEQCTVRVIGWRYIELK